MLLGRATRQLVATRCWTAGAAKVKIAPPLQPLPCYQNLQRPPPSLSVLSLSTHATRRLFSSGGGSSDVRAAAAAFCWKCSAPLRQPTSSRSLFCPQCGVIQAPDARLNYFDLLLSDEVEMSSQAQPPTYRLDLARLASSMRRLQWQLHPDKFVHASEQECSLAQQQSAKVNAAYRCLSDPVQRAVYLLGLRGVAMPTEETGSGRSRGNEGSGEGNSGDLSLSQEFLAEMLDLNEALMEADRTTVRQLSERVEAESNAIMAHLAAAFDAGNLSQAKELTYRLRYFFNIRDKIREMS